MADPHSKQSPREKVIAEAKRLGFNTAHLETRTERSTSRTFYQVDLFPVEAK